MTKSYFDEIDQMANERYKKICDLFFDLCKDPETKIKVESILFDGKYNDYDTTSKYGRDNIDIDRFRRMSMAYLIINNPETFDYLAKNSVKYFHGTNANALPGILKYGMNSYKKSLDEGIEVTTGEKWSREVPNKDFIRDFISFTDVLGLAQQYTTINTENKTNLSFPIIIGITEKTFEESPRINVQSDFNEVGIRHSLPLEKINCIMVPKNKVKMITKMVGGKVNVVAIDNYDKAFFDFLSWADETYIYLDQYEKFKKQKELEEHPIKGIKEAVLSRSLKNIESCKEFLSSLFKGEVLDEHRSAR